jgi:hypothetical protein
MTSNTNRLDGMDMTDELINLLREIRPNFSDVGSRDVDTRRKQNQIDRAIELLSASKPAATEGWKMVPVEPTPEMILKGGIITLGMPLNERSVKCIYAAMLSVSPDPAAPAQSGEAVALSDVLDDTSVWSHADIFLTRVKRKGSPGYHGHHDELMRYTRAVIRAALDAIYLAKLDAAPQPSQPAQSAEPVALDIHERNALNEAVKLLPSISALRTLRAKLLAAPQSSQPVEAGDTAQTWAPVISRNFLGQIVREAWVKWAKQQPNPKPSWLSPYDELDEADKEADRQIGEAVVQWVLSIKSATWEVAPSAVVLDDGRAAFAQAAVRMLEGYAESYDAMARDRDGNGLVACTSVAFDIRRNMAGWFEAHATAAQLAQTTLTDEQRVAIRECIDYLTPAAKQFSDLGIPGMGDSKHARCIRTLRALLTAAQPASGGDHG